MFLLSLSEIYSKRSRTTSLADLSSSTSSSTAFFTFGSTSICSASPGRSSGCSTSWNKSLRAACGPPSRPMSRTSRRGDSSSFLCCPSLLPFHHTIPLASRQFHSAVRPAVVTRALAQQWHVQPSTMQWRCTWSHVWPHHVFPFVCPRLCRVGAESWGTVWLTNLPPTTRPSLHPPVGWGLKTNDSRTDASASPQRWDKENGRCVVFPSRVRVELKAKKEALVRHHHQQRQARRWKGINTIDDAQLVMSPKVPGLGECSKVTSIVENIGPHVPSSLSIPRIGIEVHPHGMGVWWNRVAFEEVETFEIRESRATANQFFLPLNERRVHCSWKCQDSIFLRAWCFVYLVESLLYVKNYDQSRRNGSKSAKPPNFIVSTIASPIHNNCGSHFVNPCHTCKLYQMWRTRPRWNQSLYTFRKLAFDE